MNQQAVLDENINAATEEKTAEANHTKNEKKTKLSLNKMIFSAMMGCLSFVLCVFVHFPQMAPFQHFVNVMAAVFLGPWYACLAAGLCGVMRMTLAGSTIQAFIGAIFGPIFGGLLYRKTKKFWCCAIGEVFGTGIVSAIVVHPFMKYLYGLDLPSPFYYVPFYIPSAIMGACMGVAVLLILKKSGALKQLMKIVEK